MCGLSWKNQMVLGTLEVFVRSTHVNLARPRWIELSFTREESIQATNKVSLNFGASQDTRGVNMVDSIQVWTRTKEAFGWPEDCVSSQLGGGGGPGEVEEERHSARHQPTSLTPVDRVIVTALRTLDQTLVVTEQRRLDPATTASALEVATR